MTIMKLCSNFIRFTAYLNLIYFKKRNIHLLAKHMCKYFIQVTYTFIILLECIANMLQYFSVGIHFDRCVCLISCLVNIVYRI